MCPVLMVSSLGSLLMPLYSPSSSLLIEMFIYGFFKMLIFPITKIMHVH